MRIIFTLFVSLLLWASALPARADAIIFVGAQTGSFAGTTSAQTITFALAGGTNATPQAGDLVVITYAISATINHDLIIDAPDTTNYTPAGSESYIDDTYDGNRLTAYRFMPGTPDATFILSITSVGGTGSLSNAGAYTVHVYRNVNLTPLEQAVQQNSTANSSIVNPGGITPTTTGTLIYVAGMGALATTRQGVYTSGDLAGFVSSAQDSTNAVNVGAGHFFWTSGAFNPATFGGGGTDNIEHSHSWMIMALAPTSGACTGGLTLLNIGGAC